MNGSVCGHQPRCPAADAADREAAKTVLACPEQGWYVLCNGVVVFEDSGGLMPDGRTINPHRGAPARPAIEEAA